MYVGDDWRLPILVSHLTDEQPVSLVTPGLPVVAPPGRMLTTGVSRLSVLYRPLGPGAENETGDGRRGKVFPSGRPSQFVARSSDQL